MAEYQKRGYLLENFRLFHLSTEHGSTVEAHFHEFCKLLLLIRGQGNYYVDGQRYQLVPGDVVLIGNRSVHQPDLDRDTPYERVIIYVSPDYLQKMSTPDCSLLSLFSGDRGPVLRLPDYRQKGLFAQAATLEHSLSQDGFGREVLSHTDLLRLLVEIGRCMEDPHACLPQPCMPENRRILEIMDYLDRNLSENIDIDRLAESFFISKYYMMRLFHQETGMTIYAYLTQKRLIQARNLMNGGMRATEACYACGFRSYSSFTRAYHRQFRTTPTGRTDTTLVKAEVPE